MRTLLILYFHCLAHKLVLACAKSADTLDYIANCELQLNQLWKLFENSAKRTATHLKVQESTKNLTLTSEGQKQVAKKLKKACRARWLSLDKSAEAVFTDFYAIIETLEQLKTEPTGWSPEENEKLEIYRNHIHPPRCFARIATIEQVFSTRKRELLTPAPCNQGHICKTKQA